MKLKDGKAFVTLWTTAPSSVRMKRLFVVKVPDCTANRRPDLKESKITAYFCEQRRSGVPCGLAKTKGQACGFARTLFNFLLLQMSPRCPEKSQTDSADVFFYSGSKIHSFQRRTSCPFGA